MKINELSQQAFFAYFSDNPSTFKQFTQNLKAQWEREGKEASYFYWFMGRVALPRIYEEAERRKPGSVPADYWLSFDYLKYLENRLKYQGKSTDHLQPAIAQWYKLFDEQKQRRAAERQYWEYA